MKTSRDDGLEEATRTASLISEAHWLTRSALCMQNTSLHEMPDDRHFEKNELDVKDGCCCIQVCSRCVGCAYAN